LLSFFRVIEIDFVKLQLSLANDMFFTLFKYDNMH
jgi:hypothetical protein